MYEHFLNIDVENAVVYLINKDLKRNLQFTQLQLFIVIVLNVIYSLYLFFKVFINGEENILNIFLSTIS